jgi:hypothetical protein
VVDNGSAWGVWTVVVMVVAAFRWCGRRIGIARRLLAELPPGEAGRRRQVGEGFGRRPLAGLLGSDPSHHPRPYTSTAG